MGMVGDDRTCRFLGRGRDKIERVESAGHYSGSRQIPPKS